MSRFDLGLQRNAKSLEATRSQLPATNCSCGCHLEEKTGSFFATSSAHQRCAGNQTWWLAVPQKPSKVDFSVTQDDGAKGKLFFFLGAPYGVSLMNFGLVGPLMHNVLTQKMFHCRF